MAEFPIGTCPSCGGKRVWIDRSFNRYPKWVYIHERGCPAGKRYPDDEQERHHAESGSCPVHGIDRVLDCRTCAELADRDDWMPE
jgi:hypothetical protein